MKKYFVRTTIPFLSNESVAYIHDEYGNHFPTDDSNYMYRNYLAWVAEGNTAEEWTGE